MKCWVASTCSFHVFYFILFLCVSASFLYFALLDPVGYALCFFKDFFLINLLGRSKKKKKNKIFKSRLKYCKSRLLIQKNLCNMH